MAKPGMDMWVKWAQHCGTALVDMGAPLGEITPVRGSAGPGFLGGYSIIQGESKDAAKKLLDEHLHLMMPAGIAFLLRGKMFIGVVKGDLMIRVGPEGHAELR